MRLPTSTVIALVLAIPSSFTIVNADAVTAYTGYDDDLCEKPSTVTISEGGCSDTFGCTAYDNVGGWGNVTYYGQGSCSNSRDEYLQSAFKDSGIFMIENYEDVYCNKLASTEVYRADGKCHYFTFGVMKIWVAQDNSMAALLTSSYCESNDWYVALNLNVSVNTGACIPNNEYSSKAVKYVLLGPDTPLAPLSRNYGRNLWPVRDESLCTREVGDRNMCRGFEGGQGGASSLLQLSNQLFQHSQWMNSFLPQDGYYDSSKELSAPLERFLQYLLPINRRVFNLWKAACIQNYDPARPQGLEDCQCAHQQLIWGISTARRIQHMTGQYELDSEWCELLKQRDAMLYQKTWPVLSDLCDQGLSERFYKQRRAFLDSILC